CRRRRRRCSRRRWGRSAPAGSGRPSGGPPTRPSSIRSRRGPTSSGPASWGRATSSTGRRTLPSSNGRARRSQRGGGRRGQDARSRRSSLRRSGCSWRPRPVRPDQRRLRRQRSDAAEGPPRSRPGLPPPPASPAPAPRSSSRGRTTRPPSRRAWRAAGSGPPGRSGPPGPAAGAARAPTLRRTIDSPGVTGDDEGKAGGRPERAVVSEAAARLDPQAILESVPEPFGLVDRDGRVIACNVAARNVVLVATDRKVRIGDDVTWFVSPHNLEGVRESLRRAWEGEAHTHHTEAKGVHLETVYSPVRGPDGGVVAVSLRIADVTARERARAELAALNATLERCVEERTREIRQILAATHDGFAAFRDGERYVDVNDAYCRMVGYTREELLGMKIQEVEVGLTADELRAFADLLARTGSVAFDARHRRKDGRVVDLEASVTWPDPAERYSFAFLRDVTARKEAETARDRQLAILEAIPELVGMSDDRRNVVYLNAAGRRLLGLGTIEGLRMPDLHPPRFRERLEGEIAVAVRRGEVWSGDALLQAADGREIPVRQVVVPHVQPDGSIPYFSTVARDVTEEKGAQAELEARASELASLNAELAQASRAKDEFLASMSHELRTPLTGVLGSAELLRAGVHGELNEKQLRTLGVLESAGRHLLAL
ncbi:PAS domain S-box protein, partial [Acidobacteria bacterium ACD]|nr:PAS domain S-box protein [Acidobacteria bacterium ACD]